MGHRQSKQAGAPQKIVRDANMRNAIPIVQIPTLRQLYSSGILKNPSSAQFPPNDDILDRVSLMWVGDGNGQTKD